MLVPFFVRGKANNDAATGIGCNLWWVWSSLLMYLLLACNEGTMRVERFTVHRPRLKHRPLSTNYFGDILYFVFLVLVPLPIWFWYFVMVTVQAQAQQLDRVNRVSNYLFDGLPTLATSAQVTGAALLIPTRVNLSSLLGTPESVISTLITLMSVDLCKTKKEWELFFFFHVLNKQVSRANIHCSFQIPKNLNYSKDIISLP